MQHCPIFEGVQCPLAVALQLCGDVTTLQYLTIGAAKAAAERLAGRPVAAPVLASVARDPRSIPRPRPAPRAASALPIIVAKDPAGAAATPADASSSFDAAAAASRSDGRGAVPAQHRPAEQRSPLASDGHAAAHTTAPEVAAGSASGQDSFLSKVCDFRPCLVPGAVLGHTSALAARFVSLSLRSITPMASGCPLLTCVRCCHTARCWLGTSTASTSGG